MTTPTREQVVQWMSLARFDDKQCSAMTYDSGPYEITTPKHAAEQLIVLARANLEATIAEQAKQLEEMAEAIRVKDEALARLIDGVTFIYGERAAHGAILSAKEALSIQPSPEILAARDQRVAAAIAMWFDQHPLTAWIATHIRSGNWKEK